MSDPKTIVSFGAGVNSTALLIGLKDNPPDLILFADTLGEKPETYVHLEAMQKWLSDHNMPKIEVVTESAGLEDDCITRDSLPGKAFGFGSCSERYKIRPQRRFVKQAGLTDAIWLVGIHSGEIKRAERTLNQRSDVRFPLIEWGWGQAECVKAIQDEGMKIPVKSACFFCPAMRKAEVIQLSHTNPDLFERAVEMETAALETGRMEAVKGLGRHWSWKALVSADRQQLKLFEDEQPPICDTCIDW